MQSVSRRQIQSDNCMFCHTMGKVTDQTCYLSQTPYTDTWPTSPSTDPLTQGTWQWSHRSTRVKVMSWLDRGKQGSTPVSPALEVDILLLLVLDKQGRSLPEIMWLKCFHCTVVIKSIREDNYEKWNFKQSNCLTPTPSSSLPNSLPPPPPSLFPALVTESTWAPLSAFTHRP